MIRIHQLKLSIYHKPEELKKKAAKMLRIAPEQIRSLHIVRQSVDARKKEEILYIYTVLVDVKGEAELVRRAKNPNITIAKDQPYQFPAGGESSLSHPPVIIGSGSGRAVLWSDAGRSRFCPCDSGTWRSSGRTHEKSGNLLEWRSSLDPESNVQFGEGGAGTFSDGKLNTLVKDPFQRNQKVLELFVEHGADPSILYTNKPHIGTDVLSQVVKHMRERIISLGGQVRFSSKVTDLCTVDEKAGRKISGVVINGTEVIETEAVVLAIGHSARDTFEMLLNREISMEAKSFAVGVRIQHPQEMITISQYGSKAGDVLGPASYKLTKQTSNGRGVYSFCMCPGGYVVNASSEPGRLAVNGMSNHDRAGKNANSALIVTVTPDDFPGDSPLAGVEYQRHLESLAYGCGNGKIPVQLYGDFKENRCSVSFGQVEPEFKGLYQFANLRDVLPEYLAESLIEGMESFDHMIQGFGREDSILAGIESRTSSPVPDSSWSGYDE